GCLDPVSNSVFVEVVPSPAVTVAADNVDVCLGGVSLITSTIVNGSGFYNYQWQQSLNGTSGWANVASGGNGPNYNVPTSATGTNYYRLLLDDLSNGCADPVSNTVDVTVHDAAVVTILEDNNPICIGGSSTITPDITGGSGLFSYQWQESPD